MEFRWQRA